VVIWTRILGTHIEAGFQITALGDLEVDSIQRTSTGQARLESAKLSGLS